MIFFIFFSFFMPSLLYSFLLLCSFTSPSLLLYSFLLLFFFPFLLPSPIIFPRSLLPSSLFSIHGFFASEVLLFGWVVSLCVFFPCLLQHYMQCCKCCCYLCSSFPCVLQTTMFFSMQFHLVTFCMTI